MNAFEWQEQKEWLDSLILAEDGDASEKMGCELGVISLFGNYELFWRYHVVPATHRPENIRLRENGHPVIHHMSVLNNNLLFDLIRAGTWLAKVREGEFGDLRYNYAFSVMKDSGDAIQKFTDLQKHIEDRLLGEELELTGKFWSRAGWKNIWKPRRDRLSEYRNFLTHQGEPKVMCNEDNVPHVLNMESFFELSKSGLLTWQAQEKHYQDNPQKWKELSIVTEEIFRESITWLNDVYGEMNKALEPQLSNEYYYHLWGLDTDKYGEREQVTIVPQGPQGLN